MEIKKEKQKDSLNKPKKINESEDLREHKHVEYDANNDLNKKPVKINESSPLRDDDIYDKKEMLTE